jgi:hypothetical protein
MDIQKTLVYLAFGIALVFFYQKFFGKKKSKKKCNDDDCGCH